MGFCVSLEVATGLPAADELLGIACIPVYTIILFVFPETLRCLVGNGSYYAGKSWFVMPRLKQKQVVPDGKYPKPPKPSVKGLLGVLLFVPNFILCCSMAFNFAGLSSMYITFPRVWQTKYGWSGSETGYAYLAPGKVERETIGALILTENRRRFDYCVVCHWTSG